MYKMHGKKNVARELSFFTSTTRSRRILLKIFELLQDPLGSHSDSCNSKFHRSITHSTDKLMEFCLTNTTKTLMKLMNKTWQRDRDPPLVEQHKNTEEEEKMKNDESVREKKTIYIMASPSIVGIVVILVITNF